MTQGIDVHRPSITAVRVCNPQGRRCRQMPSRLVERRRMFDSRHRRRHEGRGNEAVVYNNKGRRRGRAPSYRWTPGIGRHRRNERHRPRVAWSMDLYRPRRALPGACQLVSRRLHALATGTESFLDGRQSQRGRSQVLHSTAPTTARRAPVPLRGDACTSTNDGKGSPLYTRLASAEWHFKPQRRRQCDGARIARRQLPLLRLVAEARTKDGAPLRPPARLLAWWGDVDNVGSH